MKTTTTRFICGTKYNMVLLSLRIFALVLIDYAEKLLSLIKWCFFYRAHEFLFSSFPKYTCNWMNVSTPNIYVCVRSILGHKRHKYIHLSNWIRIYVIYLKFCTMISTFFAIPKRKTFQFGRRHHLPLTKDRRNCTWRALDFRWYSLM